MITDETIDFSGIISDESNDFISLFFNPLIFSDDVFLYTIVYPHQIREAEQKCKEENHQMSVKHQKLINHLNPILVKFKLK